MQKGTGLLIVDGCTLGSLQEAQLRLYLVSDASRLVFWRSPEVTMGVQLNFTTWCQGIMKRQAFSVPFSYIFVGCNLVVNGILVA
jgi:hypothetical protein